MRVIVTGGAGFIGHHVISELVQRTDWDIISLDRLDYSGNLNRLSHALEQAGIEPDAIRVVHHDLKAPINPHVARHIGKVDVILHLAAGSHVDRAIQHPLEFAMDNVIGTVNILDFARTQRSLKRFIYFSTDEVFGPAPAGIAYKERDRYNCTNPYSASKAGGEEFAVAYHNTYGLPIYITHTMNVFGPRQSPEKFIPMCIKKIMKGQKITIHSNPEKTKAGSRFYIHAVDVAEALLFLLLHKIPYEVDFGGAKCPKFNIVGAQEWDNLEVAERIASALDKDLHYEMVDFHSCRPGHDLRYALDGSLMARLGWVPEPVGRRLQQTTEWFKRNLEWL